MRRGRFRANVQQLADIDPHAGFPTADPNVHDHLVLADRRDAAPGGIRDTPIVRRIYDCATPRNEPVRFIGSPVLGPWLYGAPVGAKVTLDH